MTESGSWTRILQGRVECLAPFRPELFRGMPHRGHAGGFFDHNQMFVEIANDNGFMLAGLGSRAGKNGHRFACPEPAGGIKA